MAAKKQNTGIATIPIQAIRAALSVEVSMKRMTQAERDKLERLFGLDWREKEYMDKSESNFLRELKDFFDKWGLMLHANLGQLSRLEYVVGVLGNRSYYHPQGMNCITSEEISHLPKIAKRQQMFNKLQLNKSVHIDEVRPILQAITRVEVGSIFYVTDDEFKGMLEALKEKYNLTTK